MEDSLLRFTLISPACPCALEISVHGLLRTDVSPRSRDGYRMPLSVAFFLLQWFCNGLSAQSKLRS